MAVQSIEKPGWDAFLAGISAALIGKRAEIEVASLDLGDQIVAERLPLIAISYDRKDDLISIRLDGVDHLIRSPRELYFDSAVEGVTCLAIIDFAGARRIIRFTDPLTLPKPAEPVAG